MKKIKHFGIGLGLAALMVAAIACGAGEKQDQAPDQPGSVADSGDRQMEIAQALGAAVGSEVKVSGHLVVDRDDSTRLCSLLAESSPPQCGGDRINLLGFDGSSVPNSKTPERPSEIGTTRWTNSYITVTGIKTIDGLSDVSISSPLTEISLTEVIEMARTGQLQSIEVSGDKLEVTTLKGMTFASRKPEGTSIIALLDLEGVEHIFSGLQITVNGPAAQEKDPTSAGETTIAVTPTPTSAVTPTPTSTR